MHHRESTVAVSFILFSVIVSIEANEHRRVKHGLPQIAVTGRCPDDYVNDYCSCDINEASLSVTISCNNIENSEQLKKALKFNWNNDRFDWFVLHNSTITSYPDHIFNNLSFMGFIMSYNNIDDMDDNFFAGSEDSCEYIWMADNEFKSGFNFKTLKNLKNLLSFSIISSNLTTVPAHAFGDLPNLETILLERNKINNLGEFAFSGLARLRRIDLSWNELAKLANWSLSTAKTTRPVAINLVHNHISMVDKNAFSELKTYYVNMNYNNLKSLEENAFAPLLDHMIKLRGSKLFVGDNPIICDKSIKWLNDKSIEYQQQIRGLACINHDNINRNNLIHNF